MDHSADPLDALTIAGVAYPFTPLPLERAAELAREFGAADILDRVGIIDTILAEGLAAEDVAAVAARVRDPDDGAGLESLTLAAGAALGKSSRAAAQARKLSV